jgi:hypothetical protein
MKLAGSKHGKLMTTISIEEFKALPLRGPRMRHLDWFRAAGIGKERAVVIAPAEFPEGITEHWGTRLQYTVRHLFGNDYRLAVRTFTNGNVALLVVPKTGTADA